jgi:hypothetical protein
MFKSKSALSFKEFMSKLNELKNFGNNYGQFVIIDDKEKTVYFVPLAAVMEQKTTKLPPIIEEIELAPPPTEKEKEEEIGVIILKDPSSWSLFMNLEIDLEQNTAYKRKRSISSQDLIKAEEEEEEEDKTKKVVKRIKCVEDNNNKYAFGLLALLLWSLVIISLR